MKPLLLSRGLSLGAGQPRCEVGPRTEPWYKDHNMEDRDKCQVNQKHMEWSSELK